MVVTQDQIKKAKELLGLIKAEAAPTITTTASNATITLTVDDNIEKAKTAELEKLKAEYTDLVSKAKELSDKAEAVRATLVSMGETNGGSGLMPNVGTVAMKAEEVALIKAELVKSNDDLQKGINDKLDSMITLYTASEADNVELKKAIVDVNAKLDVISKQTPGPRSITTQNFIEKGQASEDGLKTLSLKGDRRLVISELVKAAGPFKDGKYEDDVFGKAASIMEFAGTIGENAKDIAYVADRLKQKSKIRLVN